VGSGSAGFAARFRLAKPFLTFSTRWGDSLCDHACALSPWVLSISASERASEDHQHEAARACRSAPGAWECKSVGWGSRTRSESEAGEIANQGIDEEIDPSTLEKVVQRIALLHERVEGVVLAERVEQEQG
jgi:hypothetical protein